jgi:hypothetical protein
MSQPSDQLPWASFSEVVQQIVRPSLDEVGTKIDDRISELTDLVAKMHSEVVDTRDHLDKATRAYATAMATSEANSRKRDSALEQLLNETRSALAEELHRVAEGAASRAAAAADQAIAAVDDSFRRQNRVLVAFSAAWVALLAGLVTMLIVTN